MTTRCKIRKGAHQLAVVGDEADVILDLDAGVAAAAQHDVALLA